RDGFAFLLGQIASDQAGIILGLEMSRLTRSCKDWHHLLESCAIFDTLLADHDGVYDPGNANDRLLLGLKGTMSEAELPVLRGRRGAAGRPRGRALAQQGGGGWALHPPADRVREVPQGGFRPRPRPSGAGRRAADLRAVRPPGDGLRRAALPGTAPAAHPGAA